METPKDCITIHDFALFLQRKGIQTGPNLLFRQLRNLKLLNSYNIPFKEYQANGWFIVKDNMFNHTVVGSVPYCKTFVTQKGIEEIQKLLQPRQETSQRYDLIIADDLWDEKSVTTSEMITKAINDLKDYKPQNKEENDTTQPRFL